MKRNSGFTLVELMVVLSISAVLLGLGIPAFTRLIRSVNMSDAVNTFIADASFARSEGVRRGGDVIMCRSNDPTAASPACATGSTSGWETGWIIFHDSNNDSTIDTANGDTILRVQQAVTSVDSIMPKTTMNKITFTATGRLQSLSGGTATLQFGSNVNFTNEDQRTLCISVGGRVRIAGNGTATCS